MDELVIKVVQAKLLRTRAYVSILIEPALVLLVDATHHGKYSEVKLSFVD